MCPLLLGSSDARFKNSLNGAAQETQRVRKVQKLRSHWLYFCPVDMLWIEEVACPFHLCSPIGAHAPYRTI